MLSTVVPAITECGPQELLPIMPPSVQRECVAGSGAKVRPCASAAVAQRIAHHAGLDARAPRLRVDRQHLVEVLRAVDHHRHVDRLAVERGGAAAREHRNVVGRAKAQGLDDVLDAARQHDADRHLPVVRGVRRRRRRACLCRSALRLLGRDAAQHRVVDIRPPVAILAHASRFLTSHGRRHYAGSQTIGTGCGSSGQDVPVNPHEDPLNEISLGKDALPIVDGARWSGRRCSSRKPE